MFACLVGPTHVQNNERGRQARERAAAMLSVKRQRQAEERRRQAGLVLTHDQAATRIQSALRGMIFRRKVRGGIGQGSWGAWMWPLLLALRVGLAPCRWCGTAMWLQGIAEGKGAGGCTWGRVSKRVGLSVGSAGRCPPCSELTKLAIRCLHEPRPRPPCSTD